MKKNYYSKGILLLFILALTHLNAQTLRSLADAKGKNIGNLMRDGFFNDHQQFNGATDQIVKTEYNMLVTGNKLKMSNMLKVRPINPFNVQVSDINTADIDRFINYADANGMAKRGHVMIWYNQIPTWLKNEAPTWTAQQIYDFSKSYIIALATYTAGKIDEWDVINEAILSNGFRTGTWYDIVNTQANTNGEIGYIQYFANLFKWARQGDSNVSLFYNDYQIEPIGTNKNNLMRSMVKDLKNIYNAPIDGVGLQSHFSLSEMSTNFIKNVGLTIDDLELSGFKVSITELDIKICDGDNKTWEDQRIAYRDIVSTTLSRSNCNTLLIWGVSDNDSWIPAFSPGCVEATPHDDSFQKKPAYFGIQEALMSLQTGVGLDEISTVNGPNTVAQGKTVNISVSYKASVARDVVVLLQRDNNPFTTYQTIRTNVAAGIGNLNVSLTIPASVPIVNNDYQYQVFITPVAGSWTNRIDDLNKINISITGATLSVDDVSINKIYLYPNPASNKLTVFGTTSDDQITIYDIYGKQQNIAKRIYSISGQSNLNLENLVAGFYIVNISRNNSSKSLKLIKK